MSKNKNSFTSSKPNLINDEVIKNIKTLSVNDGNMNVKSVDWTESLSNFYYVFIRPNIFGIIIVICIIIFLSYKYFSKKKKKKDKKIEPKEERYEEPKIEPKEEPNEKITAIENIKKDNESELNIDEIENILE